MKALEYLEERKAAPGEVLGLLEDGTVIRQAGGRQVARGTEGKSLACVDAVDLMGKSFPCLSEPVGGLIVEGVTLLVGASKIGKSWLVLSLACAVAAGKPFLGRDTRQGDVLYLALEDSERRLQTRLKQLHENPGAALMFATECRTLEDGLIDELREWVQNKERPRLIIIDTLQKVRGGALPSRANAYAADYAMMGKLKAFADEYHIAVVLVHHLNKMKDVVDPYDRISGSTGLMGAADTTVMITRERGSDDAKVSFTGRDVWGDDFMIRTQEGRWTVLGETARAAEEYARSPIVQTCRELLKESFAGKCECTRQGFIDACARISGTIPAETKSKLPEAIRSLAPELLKRDGIRAAIVELKGLARDGLGRTSDKHGIRLTHIGLAVEGEAHGE